MKGQQERYTGASYITNVCGNCVLDAGDRSCYNGGEIAGGDVCMRKIGERRAAALKSDEKGERNDVGKETADGLEFLEYVYEGH